MAVTLGAPPLSANTLFNIDTFFDPKSHHCNLMMTDYQAGNTAVTNVMYDRFDKTRYARLNTTFYSYADGSYTSGDAYPGDFMLNSQGFLNFWGDSNYTNNNSNAHLDFKTGNLYERAEQGLHIYGYSESDDSITLDFQGEEGGTIAVWFRAMPYVSTNQDTPGSLVNGANVANMYIFAGNSSGTSTQKENALSIDFTNSTSVASSSRDSGNASLQFWSKTVGTDASEENDVMSQMWPSYTTSTGAHGQEDGQRLIEPNVWNCLVITGETGASESGIAVDAPITVGNWVKWRFYLNGEKLATPTEAQSVLDYRFSARSGGTNGSGTRYTRFEIPGLGHTQPSSSDSMSFHGQIGLFLASRTTLTDDEVTALYKSQVDHYRP